nr:DUF4180 domain-containing protein [uncultured Oscillibacter sp.]
MDIEYVNVHGADIAVVSGGKAEITTAQAALDLAMTVRYQAGAERIALDKRVLGEDFFVLSTGAAGEILQKFMNYHVKAAIYGDYSRYTSKPLRDFIYESNQGRDFFFTASREEALERLSAARDSGLRAAPWGAARPSNGFCENPGNAKI